MCATRLLRISAANIGPNRFHQNRTVSWLISMPRSANRSSTLRSDKGYLTYIMTTRRMTSRAIEIAERVAHGLKLDAAGFLSDSTDGCGHHGGRNPRREA